MANMSKEKNKMPVQEPLERNKNFNEVALGYDAQTAIDEAKRCLNCKNKPCVSGCPVKIRIPEFIEKVANGVKEVDKKYLEDVRDELEEKVREFYDISTKNTKKGEE